MHTYLHATLHTGERFVPNGALTVHEHRVLFAGSADDWDGKGEYTDCTGLYLAPGLVDLQIYGGGGRLFNTDPTADAIRATWQAVRAGGGRHFQITLSCSPWETMLQAFDACRQYWREGGEGLLGLHLEGPYFNPEKRGAHPLKNIRKPSTDDVRELLLQGRDVIRYITLAPEMFDADTLSLLLQSGIPLSAGHSNATYQQAMEGFRQGIPCSTHLFNAMSPFQGRSPGMVGAIYDHKPYTSIIADGVHCDFNALRISKEILKDRLFLITDAVTESASGDYRFVKNGDHFVDEQGTLAGSSLTIWEAVRNTTLQAGIPLEESVRMATLYPALAVGRADTIGRLAPGLPENWILFDDSLQLVAGSP